MLVDFLIFNSFFLCILWVYNKLTIGICKNSNHLVGKVVLVTEAEAGVGFETAKDLALRGARVILACKNEKSAIEAKNELIEQTGNHHIHYKHLNLESFKSVREFAEDFLKNETRLDILINNADHYETSKEKTEDGLLKTMQINHFGQFLLTNLLLPLLQKSSPSRIVTVSSRTHRRGDINVKDFNLDSDKVFNPTKAYSNSKLCNILMTKQLSRQLEGTGVTANCLHPGVIATGDNTTNFYTFFLKNEWEGAQTTIYLAVSPEVNDVSGEYFADCRLAGLGVVPQDKNLADVVWKESEKIVGLAK